MAAISFFVMEMRNPSNGGEAGPSPRDGSHCSLITKMFLETDAAGSHEHHTVKYFADENTNHKNEHLAAFLRDLQQENYLLTKNVFELYV